jgi:hypothetical protein
MVRGSSGEQLVEDDTDGPQISLVIVSLSVLAKQMSEYHSRANRYATEGAHEPLQHFRRHVQRGTQEGLHDLRLHTRKTKVGNLHIAVGRPFREKDVVRLQVAVDNSAIVKVLQSHSCD